MFGKDCQDVSKAERERVKPIGFSVVYGAGKENLARNLGVTPAEARSLKNKFLYKVFPGLGKYLGQVAKAASSQGYIKSGIYGVKITVPKEHTYKAVNYQIQVTEAEILKNSLVAVSEFLAPHRSRIALPFHDEIILQIHSEEFHLIPEIKRLIETHNLRVPIVCDVEIARECWAKKTPLMDLGNKV